MATLKVLLTGSQGRMGPTLVRAFSARYELRTYDRQPSPGDSNATVGDLQDISVLKSAMTGCDVVVHLAATSDEAPFIENLVPNNVIGVYNVYEAAVQAGVRRIVFASTGQTVNAFAAQEPLTIAQPPRPVTIYGVTKVFGEVLGRYYHDHRGLEFVGIRIGAFQEYESEGLRKHRGLRNLWLSPDDAARLFCQAIEKPAVGYALVFGTSRTEQERLSRTEAREFLDYEPSDDIAVLYPRPD